MGLIYADLTLENTFRNRRFQVRALADSGAVFMSIPEHAALQLGFDTEEFSTREVTLADGSKKRVPMVGPLRVRFGDRHCDLSALVLGDEPLMGAVPMEMMDLILQPSLHAVTVNPESPYIPTAHAK
uniref:Clan AA aspartic protease, AF_0612 family n=1 Tax=Candidatus Kentrum sp. LPFa TaxID=2126335 RepID=A0A450X8T3_9GAMM|nr:MAG: clan AA aspartic protease, AF_0612 family [Candidatus Kentron sp. LPFa]VFK25705.1 MAG: clan AA aspartic protease, AF_0612 family [Candidatus Kentron sp. LPFa]